MKSFHLSDLSEDEIRFVKLMSSSDCLISFLSLLLRMRCEMNILLEFSFSSRQFFIHFLSYKAYCEMKRHYRPYDYIMASLGPPLKGFHALRVQRGPNKS